MAKKPEKKSKRTPDRVRKKFQNKKIQTEKNPKNGRGKSKSVPNPNAF